MKININNLILTCKQQHTVCDNCLFENGDLCILKNPILNKLCSEFDIIFVKHSSSDLFNL